MLVLVSTCLVAFYPLAFVFFLFIQIYSLRSFVFHTWRGSFHVCSNFVLVVLSTAEIWLKFSSGLYGATGVTSLKFRSSFLWSDWGDLAQILF